MQRYYQVDIRDLWGGGLTPRRVWVLLRHLPAESAFVSAVADDIESGGGRERLWGVQEHLLASVVDGIHTLTYVTARAAGDKKAKAPKPIARPGIGKTKVRRLTAQQRARLDKWNLGR